MGNLIFKGLLFTIVTLIATTGMVHVPDSAIKYLPYLVIIISVKAFQKLKLDRKNIGATVLKIFFYTAVISSLADTLFFEELNKMSIEANFILNNVFFTMGIILSAVPMDIIKERSLWVLSYLSALIEGIFDTIRGNKSSIPEAEVKIIGSAVTIEQVDSLGNNGLDFEEYVASLYRYLPFVVSAETTTTYRKREQLPPSIQNAPGSGEQGVDVIVLFNEQQFIEDSFYDGYIVQCKQYSSKVGNDAPQEINTGAPIYEEHLCKKLKRVVITNNYFTDSAKNAALFNKIILLDRDDLQEMINLTNPSAA